MRFFYSDAVLRWRAAIPPLSVLLMKALSNEAFSEGSQPEWWLDGLRANFSRRDTVIEYPGASHMLPVTHARAIAKEIAAFAQ